MAATRWTAGWVLVLAACNSAPEGGAISIAPDPATSADALSLRIDPDATDPDGDPVEYLINWARDGETVDGLRGADEVPSSETDRGELWTVTVTPSDTKKFGPVLTASTEIKNGLPRVTSLTLQPTAPRGRDTLRATTVTDDPDGDTVTVTYAWTVNGRGVGATTDELGPENFAGGDEVQVIVTPNDGLDDGEPVTSDPVTIGNGAPSITGVEIEPAGRVTLTSVLTCVPVGWSDPDGDDPGYVFEWRRNGTAVATTAVFDVTGSETGDELVCTVTPFDGTDEGTPRSSVAVVVGDDVPFGCDPVVMPTDPHRGSAMNPNWVGVSGIFAIDGSTDEARPWCSSDGEVPVHIDLLVYDADYEFTGAIADVCAVRLLPTTETVPIEPHLFDAILTGPSVSYDHHGFTLETGSFTAEHLTYDVDGGTVGSCLNRVYASKWGDFATLLESQSWGLYLGEMSEEIDDYFSDPAIDDPSEPEDLYSLHRSGYMIGASQQASEYVGTQVFYAATGFEVDPDTWTLVPDGTTPYTRLRASAAVPGTRSPSEGIYSVSSYLYVWLAEPLLLGT